MNSRKQFWITGALVNLCVVALLGVTLRSKILFSLPLVDFKYVLHAHSHFAFGGWITLALMSLMVYEILPEAYRHKKGYQACLWGIWLCAAGMLVSFLYQGYAFFSILFSTLFIFVTYAFSILFIRDILRAKTERSVAVICISALIYLSVSSVGPFTLAYLMASHSSNNLLYRDAIYTYLHMQYNGFFALAVFALFLNTLYRKFDAAQLSKARRFATVLSVSIVPSLFISYLWHFPTIGIRVAAIIGAVCILFTVVLLAALLRDIRGHLYVIPRFTRAVMLLSITAFMLKSLLQTGTIIPSLGNLVFGDRAIIIGYLHLVLLGFVSLYILAQMLCIGVLDGGQRLTRIAITVFTGSIIMNELVLMVQGFGNMLMISNNIYTALLWIISIFLLFGALLILVSRVSALAGKAMHAGKLV